MGVRNSLSLELPFYNQALGPAQDTLVVSPPFTYPGVTARVFPLRTNLNLLRGFCDRYLNVAPGVYEFFPYIPYVLLVVLDYGRMALEELNLGWVSQHEVLFEVPLGMWSYQGGRRKFEGWVVNTPFIVVDNAASLTTGREAYGWPKVLAELQDCPERWLIDPRNPTRFLTLDVKGLVSDVPNVRLLEIDQQSRQNPSLVPTDVDMVDLFGRISRFTQTSMSIWRALAQLFLGAPLAGYDPQRAGDRPVVLLDSLRHLSGFYGEPGVDVVTLKQFRDFRVPALACYQALVKSRLSVARFNRGGFLGLNNILQGDITGGFQIRLYTNPTFPIIESLGLQVAEERTVQGRAASFLEPVFPFWLSLDLTYNRGETLCWRARKLPWHQGKTPVKTPERGASPPAEPRFNTIAGGAEQVWCGPYLIPFVVSNPFFHVYPLKAKLAKLGKFLQSYLNSDGQLKVEPVPELPGDEASADKQTYVYMVASSNLMFSQARSGAFIQATQISFYVGVRLRWGPRQEHQREVLVTPFTFVDNPVLATSMREVEGVPAINAKIEIPPGFLRGWGPQLKLQVDVFEALSAGLPSQLKTLLDIVPGGSPSFPPQEQPSEIPLFRCTGPGTLLRLMLKQFRDAEEPSRACYQALNLEQWSYVPPSSQAQAAGT